MHEKARVGPLLSSHTLSFSYMHTKYRHSVLHVHTFYSGIGRGIAVKLAELGAKVVAVSRTQEDLDSLQKEVISWYGGTCTYTLL